ncbi:MAG TPA: DUF4011 domain-containing protein, partial [Cytophagaceae bacterium]
MEKLLKSYQRKLTNLTSRNKSLVFLRTSSHQDIDISTFDYLDNKPAFQIIEQLLAKKNKITLCPAADSRSRAINETSNLLKKISNYEKLVFEERGAKDLFVGWPFVEGKFHDDRIIRCPLLFFPASLIEEDNCWKLLIDEYSEVTFNKSFLLAHAYFNKQSLNETLEDFDINHFNTDSQIFRTELYNHLKETNLGINFNQELFVNTIRKCPSVT